MHIAILPRSVHVREETDVTDYLWKPASGGRVPDGAVPHGYDDDASPLWVCRARVHGGVHPGKVRPGLGAAVVTSGGDELGVPGDYEVLMDRGVWGIGFGGEVPADAYPAGHEHSGDPLYVARAAVHGNNLQLGRVRRAFGAAHIGYGNREVLLHAYEVLLQPYVPVVSPAKAPPVKELMGRDELSSMVPASFTPMTPGVGTPVQPQGFTSLEPFEGTPVRAQVSPAVVDGNRVTVTVTIDLGGR
jgi:hypothetical protein